MAIEIIIPPSPTELSPQEKTDLPYNEPGYEKDARGSTAVKFFGPWAGIFPFT